ncbi:MAG TPA: UDP-3-O-(3-hydroxymyristoyl)glucosamine N-acyltransferase [Candidatus Merdimorpha stercoravium]|uniref:UDP-3-O-acylglucosamine N-acyltransferase n=1 Tax=Candidatus Merdimorpha stercoravium TaxID=2840863 RepID=A0A9D1KTG1_9FLAO|nr:UDP-3-O-(3-hydroxymyristoyl)glucosamine N-acyltransferase [Candidatus Merdimorpha stercoravium]
MKFAASQIGEILQGTIEGDATVCVDRLAKIEEATEGSITFLANPKYTHYIYTTGASVVIVSKDFVPSAPVPATMIRVEDPYTSFTTLLEFYENYLKSLKNGIEQPSFQAPDLKMGQNVYLGAFSYIGEGVVLGDDVKIYPQVYIGDHVKIGRGTVIYAGARIYRDTHIGADCIVHAGAVLGADGFGFAPQADGSYKKIPQTGNVVLEDDVEIGANTTVDRSTIGSTVIRKGSKLDNLIQIAHNVEIGQNTGIAAQTGVAGSSKIGAGCIIGGQVGIAGHLHIGDRTTIAAQSGVIADIAPGATVMGAPSFDHKEYVKSYVVFRKLPKLAHQIEQINKKLEKENK